MLAAGLQMCNPECKASRVYTVKLEITLAVYSKSMSQIRKKKVKKKKHDLNLN